MKKVNTALWSGISENSHNDRYVLEAARGAGHHRWRECDVLRVQPRAGSWVFRQLRRRPSSPRRRHSLVLWLRLWALLGTRLGPRLVRTAAHRLCPAADSATNLYSAANDSAGDAGNALFSIQLAHIGYARG